MVILAGYVIGIIVTKILLNRYSNLYGAPIDCILWPFMLIGVLLIGILNLISAIDKITWGKRDGK